MVIEIIEPQETSQTGFCTISMMKTLGLIGGFEHVAVATTARNEEASTTLAELRKCIILWRRIMRIAKGERIRSSSR